MLEDLYLCGVLWVCVEQVMWCEYVGKGEQLQCDGECGECIGVVECIEYGLVCYGELCVEEECGDVCGCEYGECVYWYEGFDGWQCDVCMWCGDFECEQDDECCQCVELQLMLCCVLDQDVFYGVFWICV